MAALPITRITLYKHGIAHVERAGPVRGTRVELRFARTAMDDVLKSLVVLGGAVEAVDVDGAEDRAAALARGRFHLSAERSLLDLLRDLRGHRVRVHHDGGTGEGTVVGVDVEADDPLKRAMVTLHADGVVTAVRVAQVASVELLDAAADDLVWLLRASRADEDHRTATLHLPEGDHDLRVAYVVPAPAWRVSYRVVLDEAAAAGEGGEALLQAWGVVDNDFGEDLDGVALELVAGRPVSFQYRLFEGHTPARPVVDDLEAALVLPEERRYPAPPMAALASAPPDRAEILADAARPAFAAEDLEVSMAEMAAGAERGALFSYTVPTPVTIGRGQSALVPLVSARVPARRRLVYTGGAALPHPWATAVLENTTGLTLERGPATVLDRAGYAGEAVVPYRRAGATVELAHAAELGIRVDEHAERARRTLAVGLDRGGLVVEELELRTTHYDVTSELADDVAVEVAHRRWPGSDLGVDTEAPARQTAGEARWLVAVPAGGSSALVVTEHHATSRVVGLDRVSADELERWRRGGVVDAPTSQRLAEVAELRIRLAHLDERLAELAEEREHLLERQQRIGGALEPLGADGEEGALRRRYVAELGAIEDRLTAVAEAERAARIGQAELRDRLAAPGH